MSSRQSDQQQKMPNGHTCRAGSVVRTVSDCWPNADAGGKRHQKLVNSGPSATEELGCAGISTWAHLACTWLIEERQANEAWCDTTEALISASALVLIHQLHRVANSIFQKYGTALLLPFPIFFSLPFFLPSLSFPPFPFLCPVPSWGLLPCPLNPARRSGERCKLPQQVHHRGEKLQLTTVHAANNTLLPLNRVGIRVRLVFVFKWCVYRFNKRQPIKYLAN